FCASHARTSSRKARSSAEYSRSIGGAGSLGCIMCQTIAGEHVMALKALLDLSGRTALVTGGSRGLGLQIAGGLGGLGARGAPTGDLPLEAWLKVIHLNLTAMFVVTQAVARCSMLPRKQGKVINIASILGLGGGNGDERRPPTLAYNTSKGGVVNFTRALAVEWGPHNINVNAIAPGFFPTRMTKGLLAM